MLIFWFICWLLYYKNTDYSLFSVPYLLPSPALLCHACFSCLPLSLWSSFLCVSNFLAAAYSSFAVSDLFVRCIMEFAIVVRIFFLLFFNPTLFLTLFFNTWFLFYRIYTSGDPKNGIIFWRVGPLQNRLPPLSECSGNPSVSMYQLALLWEAAFLFSEFFWRLFQHVCSFHDGWFTLAPAHTVLSVEQFLTNNDMTPVPHPPYSPDLTLTFFCLFPRWQKSSKGNVLLMWKQWNKKQQKH